VNIDGGRRMVRGVRGTVVGTVIRRRAVGASVGRIAGSLGVIRRPTIRAGGGSPLAGSVGRGPTVGTGSRRLPRSFLVVGGAAVRGARGRALTVSVRFAATRGVGAGSGARTSGVRCGTPMIVGVRPGGGGTR